MQSLEDLHSHEAEQSPLGTKMIEEGRRRDIRHLCDLVDRRRSEALFREKLSRDVVDPGSHLEFPPFSTADGGEGGVGGVGWRVWGSRHSASRLGSGSG